VRRTTIFNGVGSLFELLKAMGQRTALLIGSWKSYTFSGIPISNSVECFQVGGLSFATLMAPIDYFRPRITYE
jgi:hypothetical protein